MVGYRLLEILVWNKLTHEAWSVLREGAEQTTASRPAYSISE